MSVPVEVVAWIVGNDSGTSSKAIVLNYYKVPADKRDLGCWPADKDDFGRCVRLLEKFPHLSLEHMKEVNSSWKAIAENFEILLDKYKDVTERLNGKYYYYGKKKSKENQEYNLIYNEFRDLFDSVLAPSEEEQRKFYKENNIVVINEKTIDNINKALGKI